MQGKFFRSLRPLTLAAVLIKTGRLAMPPNPNRTFNLNRRRVLHSSIILIVSSFTIFFSIVFAFSPPPRTFDSKTWKCHSESSERWAMHQDFLKHYRVIGMTKQRLIELLGFPNFAAPGLLSWNMGATASEGANYFDFQVRNEKVVGVEVSHPVIDTDTLYSH
jgi:hypothetical protein